ncbi:MAG: ATP-binding cassette domain-containing protein [Paraburkholderia sp.]|uniref:ATP-binding cassette domain-containing protein n=1 Tax=Paraburkholderia sp. TaxID=1926495 RepID=UPI003C4600AA
MNPTSSARLAPEAFGTEFTAPLSDASADASAAEQAGTRASPVLVGVRNLHKWYSGVHALKGIDLDFRRGEVVGLLGDNGAGKSTLIKILSGVHRPDEGEILFEGRPVQIGSPKQAMQLGIETIHQHNSMVPTLSIARNLFIGREPLRFSLLGVGPMNQARMRSDANLALANVDLHLRSADALLGELSGGQRQGVAIARAMHFKSKLLILDEPTNHLSVKETNKVIGFVRGLSAQDVTGIFISHNLQHVFHSCDRIVAMARGEVVLDRAVADTSIEEVTDLL